MSSPSRSYRRVPSCLFVVVLELCFAGCSRDPAINFSERHVQTLRKMKFHRPGNAKLATIRMRQIHNVLNSETETPDPIQFSVVEVIHGEGKNSHSHFYLESNWDPEFDDDHGGMKTEVKGHQHRVDIFTELLDIVAWMPNIAAASNLTEEEWNTVTSACNSIEKLIGKKLNEDKSITEKRAAFKLFASQMDCLLSQLESMFPPTNVDK